MGQPKRSPIGRAAPKTSVPIPVLYPPTQELFHQALPNIGGKISKMCRSQVSIEGDGIVEVDNRSPENAMGRPFCQNVSPFPHVFRSREKEGKLVIGGRRF